MEVAILGGGCFWCLEAVFEQLRGVVRVTSGYCGGTLQHPTYEAVCSGATGHAEVVRVEFDPLAISYRQLLEVFFATHDPTALNRQGVDVGTQYRSVIFCVSEMQQAVARGVIGELEAESVYASPIVTVVTEAPIFYPAEAYHQGYFRANPGQGYCAYVVAPKAAKVRQKFASLLKSPGQ